MNPLSISQQPAAGCTLLATDRQRSPVLAIVTTQRQPSVFTAYGTHYRPAVPLTALGFTGERLLASTGHYPLGNGHRAFNPVLMRFNNPDALSPFGRGGLNGYTYCAGDPVNRVDPTGTTWRFVKITLRRLGLMSDPGPPLPPVNSYAPNLYPPGTTSGGRAALLDTGSAHLNNASPSASARQPARRSRAERGRSRHNDPPPSYNVTVASVRARYDDLPGPLYSELRQLPPRPPPYPWREGLPPPYAEVDRIRQPPSNRTQ